MMTSQQAKKASGKVKSTAGSGGFAGGTPALPGLFAWPPGAVRRLVWACVAWAALLGAMAPAAEEGKPGPLSFSTVKKLLAIPVTDNALAKHLRDYGAGFDPTPAAVAELKGLGAGPKTVAVLEELAAARRREREERAYARAASEGSEAGWEAFLKAWPGGARAAEARRRRDARAAERRAAEAEAARKKEEAEALAFGEAVKAGTEAGYGRFLDAYTDGAHRAEAESALKALGAAREAREAEEKAYRGAASEDTVAGWGAFLEKWPGGANAGEAKRRRDAKVAEEKRRDMEKAWADAKGSGSAAAVRQFVERYKGDPMAEAAVKEARGLIEDLGRKAGEVWKDPATGVELVWVPPGSFTMGSPDTEGDRSSDENPQRRVDIARGFWMGKYEVTQGQWESVMGSNPSSFKEVGKGAPVENVSWDDCQLFIQKLNAKSGTGTYRLPSEAEWEYACRARTATPFAFGERLDSTMANFDGTYPYGGAAKGAYKAKTTPVGSFKPNGWGLYDMHGNVWEWCEDAWHASYEGAPADGSAWITGGDETRRLLRGGSWSDLGNSCRSALRLYRARDYRHNPLGCRLVYVSRT